MCTIHGPPTYLKWPPIDPELEEPVPGIPDCYKRTVAITTPMDYYRRVVTVAPQHRIYFEYLVNEGEIICKHVFHAHSSVKKLAWLLKEHLEDNGRMSFKQHVDSEPTGPFRMWRMFYGRHEVVTHYFMYGPEATNACNMDIIEELRNPTDKRRFTDRDGPEGPWVLLGGNGSGAIYKWNTLDVPEPHMYEGYDNRGHRYSPVETTKVRKYLEILFNWYISELFDYLRVNNIPQIIRRGENQPLIDENGVRHLGLRLVMEPSSHDGEIFDINLRRPM